jgi:glycosyltransferase involved in cell wall biosynthesis
VARIFDQLAVFVLTYNEAANIDRVLSALVAFPRVIVLDSGSSDDTVPLAKRYANVEVHTRAFDTHAAQCNHVIDHLRGICHWLLSLDADYLVTPELLAELQQLDDRLPFAALQANFVFCMDGAPLPGSLYPPRAVLFDARRARYVQQGHTQRLQHEGAVGQLAGKLWHDDRKPFDYVLRNQKKYAALEAKHLRSHAWSALSWPGRVRRLIIIAPWLGPLYALIIKGLWRAGRPGWKYAYFRWIAEWEIAKALLRN